MSLDEGDDKAGRGARRSPRLRQRVAWMYYVEEMTQSAIANALGIGRITVVRLLAEARALREVRIGLSREISDLAGVEIEAQKRLGVSEVVAAVREASPSLRSSSSRSSLDHATGLVRP